jgi:hypothetical protein
MRSLWLKQLRQLIVPVLDGFVTKTLKSVFTPQVAPDYNRPPSAVYIELFCRTCMGTAPLFQNPCADTDDIRKLLLQSFVVVFDEAYIDWECGDQLLVEMANLAYAFIAYPALWSSLTMKTQLCILEIMKKAALIKPYKNNWILFKCILEVFLWKLKLRTTLTPIFKLLDEFESFYVGDSWYKDGPTFHMDYYNSFVILPFLVLIYDEIRSAHTSYQIRYTTAVRRLQRHAEYLERLIGVDGTFPLFGRSIIYRTAVFHTLAFCVRIGLSDSLRYGQVRRALGRVHERMWSAPNFDSGGFLHLGFQGQQLSLANPYSNNGSCYFTCLSFSPLGLPETHPFWTSAEQPYTQECAWVQLGDIKKDNAVSF